MKKELEYQTFEEFCNRAVELRELFAIKSNTPSFLMFEYRDYIYSHDYHNRYTTTINNKCWDWLLSKVYEEVQLNDLYSLLGLINQGRKKSERSYKKDDTRL